MLRPHLAVGLSGLLVLVSAYAEAQTNTRVSVGPGGLQGDGASSRPSISGDGRFVAFESDAANLVPGDTNGTTDVFVHDRQAGTTSRVSVTTAGEERAGWSRAARITSDGRFVVFQSSAALVADDTPACIFSPTYPLVNCEDIYLHDRLTGTTTRVSLTSDGGQANGHSLDADVSDDGRFVVFISSATNLALEPTPPVIWNVYMRDRVTGTTMRVNIAPDGSLADASAISRPTLTGDARWLVFGSYLRDLVAGATTAITAPHLQQPTGGQFLALRASISRDGRHLSLNDIWVVTPRSPLGRPIFPSEYFGYTYQVARATGETLSLTRTVSFESQSLLPFALSPDGRISAGRCCGGTGLIVVDTRARSSARAELASGNASDPSLSADGRFVAFAHSGDGVIPGDTNQTLDVFVLDRDADGDGMPSEWETAMGLDPTSAADAADDPDGDGVTNAEEYLRGGHPRGTFRSNLAEGAVNSFFTTAIDLFNPTSSPVSAVIKYLGSSGGITWRALRLDPLSRMTLFPGATAAPEEAPAFSDEDFATIVEADGLLAVERTMFWDASGYGSHAEAGIPGPSTTWHFAEGATHGRFDLFYLLQNPGDLPANVSIRFLRTNRQPPIERVYSVGANMRRTIWVDIEDPRLEAADVAARIVSDVPIVAERAMYLSVEGQPFAAGSGGAGVTTPATRWFLAEGATGAFFDMFVLIANPTPEPATLLVTYLLESATVRKTYSVAAQGRLTISVDGEDPRLANAAMSVIVESTNDVPVVVERAMWWPEGRWYEGHAVAATTTSATRWALPRVFSGPSDSPQTYVLVANPTTSAVALTLTAAIPGEAPVTSRLTIPPQSRTTLLGSTLLPRSTITVYALIVESDGPPIVVERSEYWNGGGVIWGAGTAAAATPIP